MQKNVVNANQQFHGVFLLLFCSSFGGTTIFLVKLSFLCLVNGLLCFMAWCFYQVVVFFFFLYKCQVLDHFSVFFG